MTGEGAVLADRIRDSLQRLAETVGADRSCLCFVDLVDGEYRVVDYLSGGAREADALGPAFLGTRIADIPEWDSAFRHGQRTAVRTRQSMSKPLAELVAHTNLDWVVTAPLSNGDQPLATLSLVGCGSVHPLRKWSAIVFEAVAEIFTDMLAVGLVDRPRSLAQAQWLRREVELDRAQTALNLIDIGVVWLSECGELLETNAAATRMLAVGSHEAGRRGIRWDDFQARDADGVVVGVDRLVAAPARQRIAVDIVDAGGITRRLTLETYPPVPPRTRGAASELLVLLRSDVVGEPLDRPALDEMLDRLAAVFNDVPERPAPERPDPLAELDLSPREREIVELLARGHRVATIAPRLYLSKHTVRNHLKSVFRKAGVNSQAELVELVNRATDN